MRHRMLYAALSSLIALALAAILIFVLLARRSQGLPESDATIGDARIRVEIAATMLARARGLGYRDSLPEGRGMLFTFGSAEQRSFWMKGMRFPIDIVWLRDGEVVDVTADVPPPAGAGLSLKTYAPSEPADDVLELPAGYAARHGIVRGTRLVLTR